MATVRVTSKLANIVGSEYEEFYAEAETVERATAIMLAYEEKVSMPNWAAWVAFQAGFSYDENGYSFIVMDNGLHTPIAYLYVVTA